MPADCASSFTVEGAGAAGLPLICTKVGIAPEIIQNGKNGFLVRGNPKEIADKIIKLFDRKKRERFGKITREIVRKNFDWDKIMKKYIQVYKSALKKKP